MSRPRYRELTGILLLDKRSGITSNRALQDMRHLFQALKAGHTGSLDPLATGLLPICFGEASKFSQFLLDADKRYQVRARLGVTTTTGDADGDVVAEQPVPALDAALIESVLARFRGDILQVPSMYSALKRNGVPLYELARKGIEIEREARPVSIYELSLLAWDATSLTLDCHVSKGTYIRSLVEDIGAVLGCGAHVVDLRRLSAGPFRAESMWTPGALTERFNAGGLAALDECLLPAWAGLGALARVELTEATAYYLLQGQPVRVAGAPEAGTVTLFADDGRFLGVGDIAGDGRVAPKRLVRH